MDSAALADAMGNIIARSRYDAYTPDFNAALIAADCSTVNRAAMFCAQVGHESLGLRYMEEIASGAAYEWRRDLGNTRAGDGRRFKGRGPIQLTGRTNYGAFGAWCARRGYVTAPAYFVTNPDAVATSKWGFLAAAWYWTVARPRLNSYADAGELVSATKAVNGGTNGLADRRARWNTCLRLGNRLLPTDTPQASAHQPLATVAKQEEVDMQLTDAWDEKMINAKPGTVGWALLNIKQNVAGDRAIDTENQRRIATMTKQLAGLSTAVDKLAGAVGQQQGIDPVALTKAVQDAIAGATVNVDVNVAGHGPQQ